jgi:gluconate 2-dehydrogenase alpha chain
MASKLKKADVVIVGLGAAGGIAAYPLTKAGLDVVAIEAGPRWKTSDFAMDEVRNDVRNHMGKSKVNVEVPTSRSNASVEATPTVAPQLMMNGVGGSSIHYTAQSWRFMEWNFKMRSETLKRYGASYLPAGALVEDWPLSYGDVEPFYDNVEYLIGVSGRAGNIKGKKIAAGNVLEAPRRRDYPMPPLRRSGYADYSHKVLNSLGWHPYPGPAAIHSKAYGGQGVCTYCGFCTTNGCMAEAKSSVSFNAIPQAEKTGHLDVRTNARVIEVTVASDGRVNGVTYIKNGKSYHQPASIVVLSSYIYENIRLLLLSKSKAYPNGLSNNHGRVGVGYMGHGYVGVNGLFPKRLNQFTPSGVFTGSDVWDADNFDHSGLGFIGGGGMQFEGEMKPIGQVNNTPYTMQNWGSAWKAYIRENAWKIGGAFAQMDVLSYEQNTLDLDPTHKDPLGFPVIRITYDWGEQEKLRSQFLIDKMTQYVKAAGFQGPFWSFAYPSPVMQHAYGGARMGSDPASSVVDGHGFSHEAPNLAVLGGATFLSTAGRNPTQTIQALAWRTADHIVKNFHSIAA